MFAASMLYDVIHAKCVDKKNGEAFIEATRRNGCQR